MKLKTKILFCSALLVLIFIFLVEKIQNSGVRHVEGWNRNTSRNTKDYINEKTTPRIMPEGFCVDKALLLVMVNSKPSNFEARSAIRATWAQKRANVSFFFLLGEVNDPWIQSEVELESGTFRDIIQERFIDHYNNLTLKSVAMLKLFNIYCAKYRYLMKIDDDVFLNINPLIHMLSKRPNDKNLLTGKIIANTTPFRDSSSKWFVPYELYAEKTYPDYLCGPTYVMSADVARKLYRCALETPIFYIEDVYVTGICAKKINVKPQHDPHFYCHQLQEDFCRYRNLYSTHYHTPRDIRDSYQILKNNACAWRKTWKDWFSFFNLI